MEWYCNFHESFKKLQYQHPPLCAHYRVPSSYLDVVFCILSVWVCVVLLFSSLIFRGISLQFKTLLLEFPPIISWMKHIQIVIFGMRIFQKFSNQPLLAPEIMSQRIDQIPCLQTTPALQHYPNPFLQQGNRFIKKTSKTVWGFFLLWMILCSHRQLHQIQLNGCIKDQLPRERQMDWGKKDGYQGGWKWKVVIILTTGELNVILVTLYHEMLSL